MSMMSHNIVETTNGTLYCTYCGKSEFSLGCKLNGEAVAKSKEAEAKIRQAFNITILSWFAMVVLFLFLYMVYSGITDFKVIWGQIVKRCSEDGWLAAIKHIFKG